MRVYNLTDQRVDYRGKLIPPYGSEEFDIDFIPNRDLALAKNKMLAFGALPKGWVKPQPKVEAPPSPKVEVKAVAVEPKSVPYKGPPIQVEETKRLIADEPPKEEKQEFFSKKKKY